MGRVTPNDELYFVTASPAIQGRAGAHRARRVGAPLLPHHSGIGRSARAGGWLLLRTVLGLHDRYGALQVSQVLQDATTNLPGEIQKEILGSMHDPSPAGWEELNRQYFQRLSTGGGEEKR